MVKVPQPPVAERHRDELDELSSLSAKERADLVRALARMIRDEEREAERQEALQKVRR